jgi:phenylalanyl-tRNA synthetase beta chain
MGLDDPVLDVAIPTSRPDCHGIEGIARDLAAAGLGTFKSKAPAPVAGKFPCPVQVKLEFGATPSLCPAFALRLIRGVKNRPSPDWAQHKLRAIGLRPINALVDITNLLYLRPRAAAARVRRGQSEGPSHGTARQEGREAHRTRRAHL